MRPNKKIHDAITPTLRRLHLDGTFADEEAQFGETCGVSEVVTFTLLLGTAMLYVGISEQPS